MRFRVALAPEAAGRPGVTLCPLGPEHLALVASWLERPETRQWLDFGSGVQTVTPASLRIMAQRDIHLLRLFPGPDGSPIGLVALSDIDRAVGTARLWYVLGDRQFAGRGHTSRAVAALLAEGFDELGLQAVNAWAVETNAPSIRVLERNDFTRVGRLRRSHVVQGQIHDRVLYDLLAEEFRSHGPVS